MESVSDLFSGVIINIFKDIIMLIGIVSVMFYLDVNRPFSVGCVPVIMLITLVYRIAARKNLLR